MDITETTTKEIAQNPTLRPTSFRIDEKARLMFSELSQKIGAKNQNETLHALINTWEMNQAKHVLPQKESEIETFHECSQRMLQLFLANLEDSKNVRDIVRSEFEHDIRSKDALIRELQKQVEDLKEKFSDAMELSTRKDKEKVEAENHLRSVEAELRRVNSELSQLKSENENMQNTIQLSEKAAKEYEKIVSERDVLLQQKITSDFVHKQDISELELKYKKELLEEKEKYQEKYLELVNKVVGQAQQIQTN